MARSYSLDTTGTVAASATLPFLTLIGTAAVRPKLFDIIVGSSATPADNACKFQIQRCTTAGTPGSSLTPTPEDPGDPACVSTSGLLTFSVGPTLTAGAMLLQWSQNQRATFRWVAAPGKELDIPATASNGLALMTPTVAGTAVIYDVHVAFEE